MLTDGELNEATSTFFEKACTLGWQVLDGASEK